MNQTRKEKFKKLIFFDARDVLVFGGLFLVWYGLQDFKPWIANAVCGFFVICIALFIGRKAKK